MDRSDPRPHEREYYRHATTGDRGFIVVRDGKDYVQMDHGTAPEDLREYVPLAWVKEEQHFPMTRGQLAQIAFEADKKLCFFLGLHREAKRDWRALHEDKRIAFTDHGPQASELRQHLFDAVMAALKDLAQ